MNTVVGCTLSMPAKRMRVELFDNEGNRYAVSFEGQITREKALRLLDLVELLGGAPVEGGTSASSSSSMSGSLSKYGKMRAMIQKNFPIVWFSSREVQSFYEQELKEPITLSTVATYLARMAEKGLVLKNGPPNSLKYKLAASAVQAAAKQRLL